MEAHRALSGGTTPPPSLDVQAHSEGSFVVEMVISGGDIVDLLTSDQATAAAQGIGILSPVVGALAWLRHRRQHGPQTEEVDQPEPGVTRVRWEADGSVELFTTAAAENLVASLDFRRAAAAATSPLRQDSGIDTVTIEPVENESAAPVTLDRDDAVELDRPTLDDDERVVADVTRPVSLRPLKFDLRRGFKWWVTDGTNTFWTDIHDLTFMQRVESGEESFRSGDVLRCEMRERQLETEAGELRVERTVLRVLEHRKMPPPDELPFD